MKRRLTFAALSTVVLAAAVGVLVFMDADRSKATPERREPPGQPVVLATVEQRPVPLTVSAIGTVQPLQTVAIKSRIDGQVFAVNFEEGQMVAAGDVLFRLDDRSYRIQLRQAEATLANNRAQLDRARADFKRTSDLLKTGNAAAQKYDQDKAALDSLEGTVKASEAAVDNARLNLDYTVIRAPFAGRTGAIQLKIGSTVKANDTVTMVSLTQLSPISVAFSVPERELPAIRRAQSENPLITLAKPRGSSETPAEGRLNFIDNAIDTSTGMIQLKAKYENNPPLLWPGQFVDVTLDVGAPQVAVVVPSPAIQMGQDGAYVYVAKPDRTVGVRLVKIARRAGDVVVISDGVAPGDRVVVNGQSRLADGTRYVDRDGSPKQEQAAK